MAHRALCSPSIRIVSLRWSRLRLDLIVPVQSHSSTIRRTMASARKPVTVEQEDGLSTKDRTSGIFYVGDASKADPEKVLSQLVRLTAHEQAKFDKILILASPGLARWFDRSGHDFLSQAVNRMYSPPSSARHRPNVRDSVAAGSPQLTSHVAIVDGLPAPEYFFTADVFGDDSTIKRPYALAEGIAICCLPEVTTVAANPGDHIPQQDAQSNTSTAVLTIASRPRRRGRIYVNRSSPDDTANLVATGKAAGTRALLTVPLANTLFINGSHHTAFQTPWTVSHEGTAMVRSPTDRNDLALQSLEITVRKHAQTFFSSVHVPLHALTRPRKVVDSMGNVVRAVQDSKGQPLGASTELEKAVPEFLARHEGERGRDAALQIQVLAVVMPPSTDTDRTHTSIKDSASRSEEKTQESSTTITHGERSLGPNSVSSYDEKLPAQAIRKGGTLLRVMSGGGGWGKKAGLLSLDPITSYKVPSGDSAEQSMFPSMDDLDALDPPIPGIVDKHSSANNQNNTKPTALVPTGHTIQFFAAAVPEVISSETIRSYSSSHAFSVASNPEELWRPKPSMVASVVFGTTLRDESPHPNQSGSGDESNSNSVGVVRGVFGAMSEKPISIAIEQVDGNGQVNRGVGTEGTGESPQVPSLSSSTSPFRLVNEFKIDAPLTIFKTRHGLDNARSSKLDDQSDSVDTKTKEAQKGTKSVISSTKASDGPAPALSVPKLVTVDSPIRKQYSGNVFRKQYGDNVIEHQRGANVIRKRRVDNVIRRKPVDSVIRKQFGEPRSRHSRHSRKPSLTDVLRKASKQGD